MIRHNFAFITSQVGTKATFLNIEYKRFIASKSYFWSQIGDTEISNGCNSCAIIASPVEGQKLGSFCDFKLFALFFLTHFGCFNQKIRTPSTHDSARQPVSCRVINIAVKLFTPNNHCCLLNWTLNCEFQIDLNKNMWDFEITS